MIFFVFGLKLVTFNLTQADFSEFFLRKLTLKIAAFEKNPTLYRILDFRVGVRNTARNCTEIRKSVSKKWNFDFKQF